jgi:hypothetical protein
LQKFYCHPPIFYAIKGKLSLPMASEIAAAGAARPSGLENISHIKGGMGVGNTHFPKKMAMAIGEL